MDLTICHGWQRTQQTEADRPPTREKWRAFLNEQERAKHTKYDALCAAAHWNFSAMAFGTWGGTGPECARLLHRISKRAAGWQEGDLRASQQENARLTVGLTLMRHVWALLLSKNFIA